MSFKAEKPTRAKTEQTSLEDKLLPLSYRDYLIRLVLDRQRSDLKPIVQIQSPADAYKFLLPLETESREIILALYLDSNLRLIGVDEIARGDSECAACPAYEIFKGALLTNSSRILLAHNHPHGNPTPSKRDISFSKKIQKAALILDIKCIDHIIVGYNNYFSFMASDDTDWFGEKESYYAID